jgi:hypothetical protein
LTTAQQQIHEELIKTLILSSGHNLASPSISSGSTAGFPEIGQPESCEMLSQRKKLQHHLTEYTRLVVAVC